MYITYKNTKKFVQRPASLNAQIDMMFGGIDLTNIHLTKPEFVQEKLVRTYTTVTDTVNTVTAHNTAVQLALLLASMKVILTELPEPEQEYYSFKIPKRTKGFRDIDAPNPKLKEYQKQIAYALIKDFKILCHDSAWAYVSGRDVVGAMKEHINNESRWYLKLDLKNFFGSCSPEFITTQLSNLYPFAILDDTIKAEFLEHLTKIACKDGGLPQGTPLSPLITNLCMVEYDYKINKLIYTLTEKGKLSKQKYIYTRYADDIIISAKNKFEYQVIIKALKKLFKDTPLVINEDKTRFGSSAGRNWNLGVMCNKDNKMTVGYKRKKDIKNTLYHFITDDTRWDLESLRWLLGQLSWLRNVEPDYFNGLIEYYYKKTNVNAWNKIIQEIKSYN